MRKSKNIICLLAFILISLISYPHLANHNNPENELHNTGKQTVNENNNSYMRDKHPKGSSEKENETVQPEESVEKEGENLLDSLEDLSVAVLVNKKYKLGSDYAPDDLVTVSVPTVLENPEVKQLRKVAADALYNMFEDAKKSNIYLYARSGYRSYQTQVHLFNSYKERNGEEAANRYSARPGHSEHQTGLAMDVTSESVNFQLVEEFDETEEGRWLSDNSHKYGFIIRYPKGAEEITGYIYEPWHIRYLGVDLASAVYKSGLTYEEFLDKEGIIDEINPESINK